MIRHKKPKYPSPYAWYRMCIWRIAYSVDYRGVKDDQMTFVFRGAWWDLLDKVFGFSAFNLLFDGFTVKEERDIVMRNGKGYWRLAVQFSGLKPMASQEVLQSLVERRIQQEARATVTYFDNYEKFLNI